MIDVLMFWVMEHYNPEPVTDIPSDFDLHRGLLDAGGWAFLGLIFVLIAVVVVIAIILTGGSISTLVSWILGLFVIEGIAMILYGLYPEPTRVLLATIAILVILYIMAQAMYRTLREALGI